VNNRQINYFARVPALWPNGKAWLVRNEGLIGSERLVRNEETNL